MLEQLEISLNKQPQTPKSSPMSNPSLLAIELPLCPVHVFDPNSNSHLFEPNIPPSSLSNPSA